VARSRGRSRSITDDATDDDLPACSCDCCDVVARRPDEFVNEVHVKCSPSHGHSSDVCGEQCAPREDDPILGNVAQNRMLDYQRFCFFECKPGDGSWLTSPAGTQCVALEDAEAHQVLDVHGNAMDPASIFGREGTVVRTALLLSTAQHRGEASAGAPAPAPGPAQRAAGTDDEPSPEEIAKIIKTVSKGRQQAQDREKAAETSAEDALRLAMQFTKSDPLAAIRTIETAADRSRKAAERSRQVASQAGQAAQSGQQSAWEEALNAADVKVMNLRQEARRKAEADAHVPKLWREYAAEAVQKASKPYLDSVKQAQQVAQQWDLRASEAFDEARSLTQQALQRKADQEASLKAGDTQQAMAESLEVEYLEDRAKTLTGSARQMHGTAKDAAKTANQWYKTAQEAAQRAVAEMKFPPEP